MYYIGIDLGGTSIAYGIVTEDGQIVQFDRSPTRYKEGYEAVLSDMVSVCKKMLKENNIGEKEIISIGIGAPGTIDTGSGTILYANNLEFKNVNVRAYFKNHFDLPVYLDNDANCAALGESVAGAAKGYKNSVTVTLGTGVGSGIIIDGKLYSGAFGGGGELGHHVIVVDGIECNCGRKGCMESYCTANALIRDAKSAIQEAPDSEIWKLCKNNADNINAKTVFDAYNLNDTTAKALVKNYVYYLADGLANAINILQPEVIVIGGGVSLAGESLLEPLRSSVYAKLYGGSELSSTKIEGALLGNDAGIIGAAFLKN